MLTLEELERRAYISGNVELANAYGAAIDEQSQRELDLDWEVRRLENEVQSLERQLSECDCGS